MTETAYRNPWLPSPAFPGRGGTRHSLIVSEFKLASLKQAGHHSLLLFKLGFPADARTPLTPQASPFIPPIPTVQRTTNTIPLIRESSKSRIPTRTEEPANARTTNTICTRRFRLRSVRRKPRLHPATGIVRETRGAVRQPLPGFAAEKCLCHLRRPASGETGSKSQSRAR